MSRVPLDSVRLQTLLSNSSESIYAIAHARCSNRFWNIRVEQHPIWDAPRKYAKPPALLQTITPYALRSYAYTSYFSHVYSTSLPRPASRISTSISAAAWNHTRLCTKSSTRHASHARVRLLLNLLSDLLSDLSLDRL